MNYYDLTITKLSKFILNNNINSLAEMLVVLQLHFILINAK